MRFGRRQIVCQQWTELITSYLDDVLPRGLRRAIDRHLGDCPHCQEYLAQMRRTIAMLGRLPAGFDDDDVPQELIDVLQRAFDEHARGG